MKIWGEWHMRRLLLSNTMNTRDLGGYPIGNGKETAYNTFVRSDVPVKLADGDLELLLTNNITTIVDLRNDEEVLRKPCAFKNHKEFEYYHCKIYGEGKLPACAEAVVDSYFEMVDEQTTVLSIMRVFSNANGGVLYHCTAGKDRTGVISALLLLLAGVSKEDILADYQISEAYLQIMLQQFCETNNVDLNIITPKIAYMEKFLELFHQKYGSAVEYFVRIGLSDDEIQQLKRKLTGESFVQMDSGTFGVIKYEEFSNIIKR